MGLFDRLNTPVFYADNSTAAAQLEELEALQSKATGETASLIESEIKNVRAGISGEKQIRYELENSHLPMYVLHDIYLEHNGLTAQIDYLIITRRHIFVIECKNLFGNIEINNTGDFIRTIPDGKRTKREGIYSPITQNRRHLELIKQIRAEEKSVLTKFLFEKSFYNTYNPIVVLANPKTVLLAKYAKKEVREQVIRADQLVSYIRRVDASSDSLPMSDKEMEELAAFFAGAHKENKTDYLEKFRKLVADSEVPEEPQETQQSTGLVCPKCGAPMVKRIAKKGINAGNEFWGCSRYPSCRCVVNTTE